MNGNVFTINKINKRFKFSYSRPYDGNVKQVRVLRGTCNRYSIVIVTDSKSNKTYEKSRNGASVGIDFGLKIINLMGIFFLCFHAISFNGSTYTSPFS